MPLSIVIISFLSIVNGSSILIYRKKTRKEKVYRFQICFVKNRPENNSQSLVWIPWNTREFKSLNNEEINEQIEKEEGILTEIAFNTSLNKQYKLNGVKFFSIINMDTGYEIYLCKLN